MFHPYHTKAPPLVIRSFIERHTEPGDLVLDPFCGSGMTGVAARECGRRAHLVDLSPAATFIAAVNTTSADGDDAARRLAAILDESEAELGWLYRTADGDGTGAPQIVNHVVWCDVFTCPACGGAFPFVPHGVTVLRNRVRTRRSFACPHCRATLDVRRIRRVMDGDRKRRHLVWVDAGRGRARRRRPPTPADRALAARDEATPIPSWYPKDAIDPDGYSARLAQLGHKGITDVSRLVSPRNLRVFADLWARVSADDDGPRRRLLRATLTSVLTVISERQGYFGGGGGMSGNLYMPIVRMEKNPYLVLRRKLRALRAAEAAKAGLTATATVRTGSAVDLSHLPDGCADFCYTDPPFGANIIYSEMNLAMEAWLGRRTDAAGEVVVDPARGRGEERYGALLGRALAEIGRVLRPDAFLALQFHNTRASTWNLLLEALADAGFQVERVGVLDKRTTTILGDIRPGAAKHDLVLSARSRGRRRPRRLRPLHARRAAAPPAVDVWGFVADRLAALPAPGAVGAGDPRLAERRKHQLFDRLVAHCVLCGSPVPLSAPEFYAGLDERYQVSGGLYTAPRRPPGGSKDHPAS